MSSRIDRRTFLGAGAAALAAPAVAIAQGGDYDVVIVGAGAAGIAAARRLTSGGRRVMVLEATDRIGGRCFTETTTFGVPHDRGAHVLYFADSNPVAKLARAAGVAVAAIPVQRLRIGQRFAREAELEDQLASLVRARRAIADATEDGEDTPANRALPRELGDWRATIEFLLGPQTAGKSLDELSARDLARAAERDLGSTCPAGYGAALAKLAEGLPVRFSSPVTRISTWRGTSYVETPRGTLQARAVIVTASASVLAAGKIRFEPALPRTHAEAFTKLSLGTYERIALELPGDRLGLGRDAFVVERASGPRTACLLANVGGSHLHYVDVGGKFAKGLLTQGEPALRAFALDWLAGLFGNDVKAAVKRTHVTQWGKEPWTLGAMSAAAPGGQAARAVLAQPVRDRVHFAGDAVHETLWGTVNGAWESGEQAADKILRPASSSGRQRPTRRRRRR